jgi:glycosyltransferase involved in cell wall biosynthesis
VIVDGGSTDATLARLEARAALEPRMRISVHPGNISAGRNAAVRAARHGIIACTDAGVIVDAEWLERIARRFEADPSVDVVAGFYRAEGTTAFERAAAVVSAPGLKEVDRERFLPSARSLAFRRDAWSAVGGFDESLAFAEDTWFALSLRRAGFAFAFVPEAIVVWRPRGTLGSYARQFARYGRGDGGARLRGGFYATLALKYALGLALLVGGARVRVLWVALAAGIGAFAFSQARRGRGRLPAIEAVTLVPALKVVYDLALLLGYARGLLGPRLRPPEPSRPARGIPRAGD